MPHPTMDVFLWLIFNFIFFFGLSGGFLCDNRIPNCIELERSGEAQLLNLAYKVELGPIVMQTKPH
jgi:hypothetical protein